MAKFNNDGSWKYLGKIDKDDVFVKSHDCIYVNNGEIVPSPEERELVRKAKERIKHITTKPLEN